MAIHQITNAAATASTTNPTVSFLGTFSEGTNRYAVLSYSPLAGSPFGGQVFKSTDAGATWTLVASCSDNASRRTGRSNVSQGGNIYILAQTDTAIPGILLPTRAYSVHRFNMATDAMAVDFASSGPHRGQPPSTQGWTQGADSAIIGVRSDGSIVLVYCSQDASGSFGPPVPYTATQSGLTLGYTIPEGEIGEYWSTFASVHSGGTPPYRYTVIGTPPPGIDVPINGTSSILSGYPTAAGTYNFTIRMVDQDGGGVSVDLPVSVIIHAFTPIYWSAFYAIWNGTWGTPVKIIDGPTAAASHFPLALLVMPDDRVHIWLGSETSLTPAVLALQGFHHVTLDAGNVLHTYQNLTSGCPTGTPFFFVSQPIYDGAKLWINVFQDSANPDAESMVFQAADADDPAWSSEFLSFPGGPGDIWRGIITYGGWTSALSIGGGMVDLVYLKQSDAIFTDDAFIAYFTQISPPSGLVVVATTSTTGGSPTDQGTIWWATKASGTWAWTKIDEDLTHTYWFAAPSMPVGAPTSFTGEFATGGSLEGTFVGIQLLCNNPPNGTVGVPYDHDLVVVGGTAPYTFTLVSGSLPPGLALNSSTGEIAGTPTTAGTYPFTVRVVDSLGNMGQVTCSITINQGGGGPGVLSIRCNLPPVGCIGEFYFHSFSISGGNPPYSVQLISGQLPPGLTFDPATGVISGTPTGNGLAVFGLRVTDAQGNTATCICSIVTTCC